MLRIKMVKSLIGQKKKNKLIIASLGLRKMGQTVEQPDNGSIRGMIHHVKHMLEVEAIESAPKAKKASKAEAPAAVAVAEEAPAKPKRAKKETTD